MTNFDEYQFARVDWEQCAAVMLDDPEDDSISTGDYTVDITRESSKSVSVRINGEYIGASGSPVGLVNMLIDYFANKNIDSDDVVAIMNDVFSDYDHDDDE